MQALSTNATQAAAQQASQATSELARSAAMSAPSLGSSDAAAQAGQALSDAASSAAPAASAASSGAAPAVQAVQAAAPAAHAAAQTTVQVAPHAADAASAAAAHAPGLTAATPPPGGMIDAGHSLLGTTLVTAAYLCLILGAIFLAVWLLRRYGPASIARVKGPDNPRLIGRLMLGAKQSVCVVRVHDRNLVLGVTEEHINLLAETETPAGRCYEEEDDDAFTRFAEELAQKHQDPADGA